MKKIDFDIVKKSDFTPVLSSLKTIVIFAMLFFASQAKAQVSLTATAGVPAGAFGTLKAAFDAINAGTHQGVIAINIAAPGTTETASAVLNSSGTGAASYTSVGIQPTANAVTITGNLPALGLIKLNGADNVTINGFFGGTRQLTITNSAASATASCIWVASSSALDGATNNVIQNCIITGTSSTIAAILSSSGVTAGASAEAANSSNTYQNNLIHTCFNGIGINGIASGIETGNVVTGNSIGSTVVGQKLGFEGISIFNQTNITITLNTIFGINSTVTGTADTQQPSGIDLRGSITGGLVSRNNISDIFVAGFWGSNAIQLNSSSPNTGLTITNNFMYGIFAGGFGSFNSSDDGPCGICLNTGGGYNIYFNSTSLVTNNTTTGFSAAIFVGPIAGTGNNIRNNIFSNQMTTGTRFAIISTSGNTVYAIINHNDYFTLGANLGRLINTDFANIAAWRTATGQDVASLSVNPQYTSTTDLHLLGSSSLDAIGTTIAGTTVDIDNNVRNLTNPDIGADEFTPPNCFDPVTGGTASATSLSICASGTTSLSSIGYSFGLGISYQWEVSSVGAGGPFGDLIGETNPSSASIGTIGANRWYRLRVRCNAGAPGYSNVLAIVVNNPTITGSTSGTRCGVGTVSLAATGANLNWYAAATGGTSLGIGSPFTTPVISATTNFYVSASANGAAVSGGKPSTNGGDGSFTSGGIRFTATSAFILNSVVMYPQNAGSGTINLFPGTNTSGTPLFTQNYTFAAGNPAGVTVNFTGWTIPAGSYTIFQSANAANCWRDFPAPSSAIPAVAYPYNIGSDLTLTDGSLSNFYYFFYNWNVTPTCEGLRTAVAANVTPPPAITPSATPATLCLGSSSNLNVTSGNAGYTYTWTPGPLSGAAQTITPTNNGTFTYTITASDVSGGANNGCVNVQNVTLTVNPAPTALTVTPPVSNICAGPIITPLVAAGAILNNISVIYEPFETAFASTIFTQVGTGVTAAQNTSYFKQGTSSVKLTHANSANGGIALTNNINLSLYTNPILTFNQICGLEQTFDFGHVQYSTDGGLNYFDIPSAAYTGAGTIFLGGVNFSANSYTDWDAQFAANGSNPGIAPATSLWKRESVNLSAYTGSTTFRIRFLITADGSDIRDGWYIDSVGIRGTTQGNVTWTSVPASPTWTNAAATIPYVPGSHALNLWITPAASVVYTATSTAGAGCTVTATSNLTVASVAVGVSVAASPSSTICAGTSVTFTATPVNGGSTPFYTWFLNGSSVASGIGLNTYTNGALLAGNTVYCTLLSNVGSCATNNPATSNTITMTVNPNPAVSISGLTTLCDPGPTVLTANASVTPGAIATYEWFLGAVSQGAPSASNTFNAIAPGNYTVEATTVAGCKTTSAIHTVAYITYNITVTAGPNGTITPSGVVAVNCGTNITFTITPNAGYTTQTLVIDGTPIVVAGTYTFTNVLTTHTISATFGITGCPIPPLATAGPDVTICSNVTHTLAGSIGGSATMASWSGGTGTYNPNANTLNAIYTPSAAEITAGTVTLTLTSDNPNGAPCIASTSNITITIKNAPAVTITGPPGFCPAGTTTLTANATISPVSPLTYQWTFTPGPVSLGTAITQSSTQGAGTYTVAVTGNGCVTNVVQPVILFVVPSVSIVGSNTICTNTNTTLNANVTLGSNSIPPTGFQWKLGGVNIGGATSGSYSTTIPGNYTVQVTDIYGCVSAISAIHVLSADLTPLTGNYTISSISPASCTNYISFASAVNDLNIRTISGNVRFDVDAGYTETVPNGGLALGTAALNASVVGRTITFTKTGIGANPLLTAYVGTTVPSNANPDGIFSLRGVDNVNISSIDLIDNNVTNPATMEYGYGLFKLSITDGAQNNNIINCNISLSRVNNASGSGPMPDGSTGILVANSLATAAVTALTPTAASGANSNNVFNSNIISNCNTGIALMGFSPAGPPFNFVDNLNDVGGIIAGTGNQIINFGGGGTVQSVGIRFLNQWAGNIGYNTINNNNGAGVNHPGVLKGILTVGGTTANISITNNNITIRGGGTTQAIWGIDNGTGNSNAANTVTLNNNTVTGNYTTATTGLINAIFNNSAATNLNISGNTVQNFALPGTGQFFSINNNVANVNLNMSDNFVLNNTITSTGAFNGINTAIGSTNVIMSGNTVSGNTKTMAAISASTFLVNANSGTTATVNSNTITNNNFIGPTVAYELACINIGAYTAGYTCRFNNISNNGVSALATPVVMTINGIRSTSIGTVGENVNDNNIRKLYVTGASTGLQIVQGIIMTSSVNGATKNIIGNDIDSLYVGAGLSATIYGIRLAGSNTINAAWNKIHTLIPGQSATAGSYAAGMRLQNMSVTGISTMNVYNNMIGIDYTGTSANGIITNSDGLKGIEYTTTNTNQTLNAFFNSIHLKGTGGAGFGSSGIGVTSVNATLDLRNSIIDNQATFNGAGRTVALRRVVTTLGTVYVSTSNNNSFYAGTASANNLLYFDGTNSYQTLAAYKTAVTPRELQSVSGTTAFVAPPTDLHLDPANNCLLDAGGVAIAGITLDYDSATRNATNPDIGCDEFDPTGSGSGRWKGVDTDWTNAINWCGTVPTTTTNVLIPEYSPNYPDITQVTPVCNNITIENNAAVTVSAGGKLAIYGAISNPGSGSFNSLAGTIEMAGSSAQTIPNGAFDNDDVGFLIVNNASVILGGALDIHQRLSFTGSNRTFATAGFLTIKSAATGTANVADITNAGTNTGNNITGDVTVERFTYIRRAWRLLAVPTQNNLQTIKEAWQENQGANVPLPAGFGSQISKDSANWNTTGFDFQTTPGPSMKVYDPTINNWRGITSTINAGGSDGKFKTGTAYMTLIRGDRTINFFQAVATTSTVLREKGALVLNNSGPYPVLAGQFAAIGNPYASAVDFTLLTKANLQDVYYLWDPALGTLGGYQTFLGPTYTAIPGGGSYGGGNKFIESGQGFFVRAPGPAGSVTFGENDKVNGSNLVSRITNGPAKFLRTNIYQITNGTPVLYDGVMNEYDAAYSDDFDDMDAVKLGNFTENLGIEKGDKLLVADRRSGIVESDSIFLKLGQLKLQDYKFEFIPENLGDYGVEGFLEDLYLNTKTPLSLTAPTSFNFTVINEAGSYAANRFRIVFKALAPVPVTFLDVRADKQNKDVLVSFKVENELNIHHYEVEKSLDGQAFSSVGIVAATGSSTYSWLDQQAKKGYNFYRIRSVGNAGDRKWSKIVNAYFELPAAVYSVFPNPVKADRILKVKLEDAAAGTYKLRVINTLGQTLLTTTLNHAGGNNVYQVKFPKNLSHGQYQLELTDVANKVTVFKVLY